MIFTFFTDFITNKYIQIKISPIPCSWFIAGYLPWAARYVLFVEQRLLTIPYLIPDY